MAKKGKRRRRIGGSRRRHRRSNPMFGFGRVRHRHHRRRRRNPGGFGGNIRGVGSLIVWGGAGAVASRVLPRMVVPSMDNGWTGYALNGATAFVGGMLVGKFAGPDAGQKFTAGGIISVVLRVVSDYFGSSLTGLNGLEYYIENNYPLPTAGTGPYLLNPGYSGSPMLSMPAASPAAALPAAAPAALPGQASDDPSRWSSRWAA